MNQCYRLSAGRLLMASSFNLSTARVYFSVCFKPLWPRRLATVLMLAPLLRMFTAKEWRAQCQLMCLSMPARFTHRLTDLQQLSYDGRLKTSDSFVSPSFGLPTRWMSPSLRGKVLILTKQGQKWGILSKIREIEKHCKSLYINYFITFPFLCLRRLCSGSGYLTKHQPLDK